MVWVNWGTGLGVLAFVVAAIYASINSKGPAGERNSRIAMYGLASSVLTIGVSYVFAGIFARDLSGFARFAFGSIGIGALVLVAFFVRRIRT